MTDLICLIESVKNHPKLFINSDDNDEDETKEWAAVAETCKMSVADAQEQWNQLLVEYVDYLKSNHEFPLAKYMDFLQPYFFTVIDHEIIDEDELLNAIDSKNIDENNASELKEIELKKDNSFKKEKNIKIAQQTNEANLVASSTTPEQIAPAVPKDISIKTSLTTQNESSPFSNLTSLELIFLGYAKQIQKMPTPLQLKLKRKIAEIIDEAEVETLN